MRRWVRHVWSWPGAMSPWALHVLTLAAVCAWLAVPLLPYWPRAVVTTVALFVVLVLLSELRGRAEALEGATAFLREDVAQERPIEPGGPL